MLLTLPPAAQAIIIISLFQRSKQNITTFLLDKFQYCGVISQTKLTNTGIFSEDTFLLL